MNTEVDVVMDEIQWTSDALLREGFSREEATTILTEFSDAFGRNYPISRRLRAVDETKLVPRATMDGVDSSSELWIAFVVAVRKYMRESGTHGSEALRTKHPLRTTDKDLVQWFGSDTFAPLDYFQRLYSQLDSFSQDFDFQRLHSDKYFYSPYTSFVQSSMMGKSRK